MNNNLPLFTVIFKDGSIYRGGDNYFDTGWKKIPTKPIKRIFYLIPTNDYLCLTGEKFFHMVEATTDLNGKLKGQNILRYAYIMTKKGNKIISYRITLTPEKSDRYHIGDITIRTFNVNDKFIRGLNPNGWKPKLK